MGKGKRTAITVISSSDDGEYDDFVPKSRPKSASVPRNSNRKKRPKKASLSNSGLRSRGASDSNDFAEIKRFFEEFEDDTRGFKVSSTGHGMCMDLWADKYKPRSLEELAVHKKKVQEVKALFEERFITSEGRPSNNVILFSGPAGVGKSATIHAIASHFGATVCEWNTPTPTIWQEHMHNSSSGLHYTSKLDEFEIFVDRIRKYGIISSSISRTPVILVIDDLPLINGEVAYRKLRRCLHLLVLSVSVPTVILITDYGNADFSDYSMRYWEELQLFLQEAGACKVAFNPITVNFLKKTLLRISREEHCEVSGEELELIAKCSGGDIRHAITSLQYFCLRPYQVNHLKFPNGSTSRLRESLDKATCLSNGHLLSFGRDETLSLFHALGKFLHNKRETEEIILSGSDPFILKDHLKRLPLKMDAPEVILCQAYGQSRPVADFLHENVLDFVSEEAIDDASVVASYLSDADLLLASLGGKLSRNFEAENVVQSAAASVAVRGVLYGNSSLAPSRWHSIRRPKLWQVEQSLWRNKSELLSRRSDYCSGLISLPDLPVIATETRPIMKWIGYRASSDHSHEGAFSDCMDLDEQVSVGKTSEDEIEDW